MFDDTGVSRCCTLARQGLSENDLCMSMRCVNSMFDDIDASRCCIIAQQGPSDNDLRISKMHMFFMFDEQINDEAIRDTMISST